MRITAGIIAGLGIPMATMGAQLAFAGGTLYYLTAGLLMSFAAVELWRAQPQGFYAYAITLLITLGWAVVEAGNAFWLVGSRIWLVGLIALWLCSPKMRRALWGDATRNLFSMRCVQVCATASALVLGAMVVDWFDDPILEVAEEPVGSVQNPADWLAYGGNSAGTRYSPHAQINQTNVRQLVRVWETDTGRSGRFSGTPIQIDDGIYLCTAQNVVLALDADSGAERWRYDPENDTPPWGMLGNCRGVTHYQIPGRDQDEVCAARIYTATTDARMIALDKNTGKPCTDFGDDGQISLLVGMGEVKPYFYFVTSPPTLADGSLVVGGWVLDNQDTAEPSGVVRAYDAVTGTLNWAWDIGRDGQTGHLPVGEHYTRGTPNVWSLMSADDELGLVYVPTGNATPDYFGGHRTEVMDKFASSVVAIDTATGLTRWHFQTTHHDIWDYDVPSQPTLVDLKLDGSVRQAVIVPTKRGEVFVLDRATGEPITEVTEVPVPQSDLAGERTAATQPFSTGMPSFAYPPLTEADMFGYSPFDQIACRKRFVELRWEGPMTPPSVTGTLLYPGPAGGMNWGSVAVDEARQLMVVNSLQLPFTVHLVPREDHHTQAEDAFTPGYGVGGPQHGTPYGAVTRIFTSPLSLPCLKPPYGEIALVDLTTQQTVWRRGTGPLAMGLPHNAGSFVTAGDLIFNAGVSDGQLRAIDLFTGNTIWQDKLTAASDATPMTYVSPKTGKQYVLVTVPGGSRPADQPAIDHDGSGGGDNGNVGENVTQEGVPIKGGRVIAYGLP